MGISELSAVTGNPTLSIVVSMLNEVEVLPNFLKEASDVLDGLGESYEIIFVDDGSSDGSSDFVIETMKTRDDLRLVQLSRNFGKELALTAGLDHAVGLAVIPMDADLQDPPAVIPKLVEKWREGHDVVHAIRSGRSSDTWRKRSTAKAFYVVMAWLSGLKLYPDAGDFRLMDRRVVDEVVKLRESNRFMKGLFAWVGFEQTAVHFERPERAAGTTKFNFWKLWNFALDGITGYSTLPLRVAGYLGMGTALIAFFYGLYLFGRTLLFGVDVPGFASIMVAILFLGGLQLTVLGVIGEYLGRAYHETKRRPLYIVRRRAGFGDDDAVNPNADA